MTKSGKAILLINPHTSFYFRPEVHVVSKQGLNAYGAVTWGQFFVYQGFNEKTGWMHTSGDTDVKDEYAISPINIDEQPLYKYGDEYRPMEKKDISLAYKTEGGTIDLQSFTIYRTHHGPVTHEDGDKLVATAIMWDPVNALMQSFLRTKKSNHTEFREMMNMRTNSSNNTVYADADGTIAYYHGNFIPKRSRNFDFSGILDGENPDTDWQGLHEVDECIVIVNPANGWIQNCNSTPFTVAAEYSPRVKDFPRYMSRDHENFRGANAIRLLSLAENMTLDDLITLAYDSYLGAFEVLIPGLLEAVDKIGGKDTDLKAAAEILRDWDYRVGIDSEAMTLAHYYASNILQSRKAPAHLSDMKKMIYYGTQSPLTDRLYALKSVLDKLHEDFGGHRIQWAEVNRYQRLDGRIRQLFDDDKPSIPINMASGNWGALAAYGASYHNNTKRIYGTRGNSFVAVVEFGPKVKAKSLLAGGQCGDPNSPHFSDQAQRYADAQFKEVAFYREDVERRVQSRYKPGS